MNKKLPMIIHGLPRYLPHFQANPSFSFIVMMNLMGKNQIATVCPDGVY